MSLALRPHFPAIIPLLGLGVSRKSLHFAFAIDVVGNFELLVLPIHVAVNLNDGIAAPNR
jgi:hypothetical protein